MPQQITDTFTITIIKKSQSHTYTIEANGPKGIQVQPQPFHLSFSPQQQSTLANLVTEEANFSPNAIQEIGQVLYKAVFTNQILVAYGQTQGRVRAGGVRLQLQVDPPELAALPWEAMYDGQEWLAVKSDTPLVRVLPQKSGDKTLQKLQVRGALKILFVGASPADLPHLETEATTRQLQQLLKEDIDKKRIVFDVLLNATLDELHQQLVKKEYHILYFAGHGSPEGIYLDDGQGEVDPTSGKRLPGDPYLVSAQILAQALEGKPTRLIFLAACNTAAMSDRTSGLLTNFAQELTTRAKLPALVAMQYSISDIQANQLTAHFFTALAAFHPVDVALAEARKALVRQGQVKKDVIAPVMYLQAKDGTLFRRAKNWAAIAIMVAIIAILAFIAQTLFFQPDRQGITNAQRTAQVEKQRADTEEKIALARQLAFASSQPTNRLDESLLLSLESLHIADTSEGRNAILTVLQTRAKRFLHGHTDVVRSVAFSPDGRFLASSSDDDTIRLWDVNSGQLVGQPLTGHTDDVTSVAFSPDGKLLASGSADDTIRLWDVTSGQLVGQPLAGHTGNVNTVAFSPDGKLLASGSADNTIRLWDVTSGQLIGEPLTGHTMGVASVMFSPDGRLLASGSSDKTVRLWNVASRQSIGQPLTGHFNSVKSVVFSPDGKLLASGSTDFFIRLWDVSSGQPVGQPLKSTGYILAFSPNGKVLAFGGNEIKLWEIASGQPIGELLVGHTGTVGSIAFSPDGKSLASGGWDKTIILWDLAMVGHTSGVASVAFSPDGKLLASGSGDKTIRLWDVASRQPIDEPLAGHTSGVMSVAFSPDGKILASGSGDKTIRLWNVATGQPIGEPLAEHTDYVDSVVFSPDGKLLASGSSDNTIRLWDVASRQPIGEPLEGHGESVWEVAFSPDGKLIASGSDDGAIRLWEVATGQLRGEPLTYHTDSVWDTAVWSVAFSPDGKLLASGNDDKTIRLWDVATGQAIGEPLAGPTGLVSSVAFSPDGKLLASGSEDDKTIRLWDVTTRQPIGEPLAGHTDSVNSVVFSPDGKLLASGSGDIRLWDIPPESGETRACHIANRNLSLNEWRQYLGNEPYHRTCPDLPMPGE